MAKFLRKTIRLPNKILYSAIKFGINIFCMFAFKVKLDNEKVKNLRGPFVVLGAHEGYLDVLFLVLAFKGVQLNAVVSEHYIRNKWLAPFFSPLGLIAKLQFRSDLRSVADMIRVRKMGGVIAIFPAGQTAVAGKPATVPSAIAPLIRKLGIPVVSYVPQGAYFARNRVADYINFGAEIVVKAEILLSAEKIKGMSDEEIYDVICNGLYFDEFERAKTHPVKVNRKERAYNYENIITKCPNCGKERTVERNVNTLRCVNCGNAAELGQDMMLHTQGGSPGFFKNLSDYYDYLSREYIEESRAQDYTLSAETQIKYYNDHGKLVIGGRGIITLDRERLHFEGIIDGKADEFDVKITPMAGLVCSFETYFEIYTSEWGPVLCYLADPKYIVKFKIIEEQYYRELNNLK